MLLFLDFDGVLHPINAHEHDEFRSLPRLEGILRDFSEVRVVITSDWRLGESLDSIGRFFAEDIRPRIVGVTPFLWEDTIDRVRWVEISAWLRENNRDGDDFVILDDSRNLFPSAMEELICCDPNTGITDDIERLLRARLENGK